MLTPISLYPPRRGLKPRRPASAQPQPPVDGHVALGAVIMDGDTWVRWDFDGPVAGAGETGEGLLVSGQNPAAVSLTPGDPFVFCLYPAPPQPGDPWHYLGPAAEVTFEDGRPGVPSTGTVTAE